MTRSISTQTKFTSGELDPALWGRIDLRALEEGAKRLKNVFVHPTGGVARRPGTLVMAEAPTGRRLIDATSAGSPFLVVLGDRVLHVFENGLLGEPLLVPWTSQEALEVDWVSDEDGLLICHPSYPIQILKRNVATWTVEAFSFATEVLSDTTKRFHGPFQRYAATETTIQLEHGGQGLGQSIAADQAVLARASMAFFHAGHQYTYLQVAGRQVFVQDVMSPTEALAITQEDFPDGKPTRDWQEQAFSSARGFASTITLHQDRLVIGGSRNLSDRLWLSRSGQHRNFDFGSGLDDEAISFRLGSDCPNDIVALIEGRHLQVFTTGAEWIVKGFPLTPSNLQVELQTRIGSRRHPRVQPLNVDGATLFVGLTGRELREFIYSDTEQAYQAPDLALLSRHLIAQPVDMAFDSERRLLCLANEDGGLATVTIDRNSNVVAWSRQIFGGAVRAVAWHERALFLLLDVDGHVRLERFEEGLQLDDALVMESEVARMDWNGLGAFLGDTVTIVADGNVVFEGVLNAEGITLPDLAHQVICGHRFCHEIEALPVAAIGGSGMGLDPLYRIVRAVFRVLGTGEIRADLGRGLRRLLKTEDGSHTFCGDLAVRALGWRRGIADAPWLIAQDDPVPFTLLAVTTEIKVNN